MSDMEWVQLGNQRVLVTAEQAVAIRAQQQRLANAPHEGDVPVIVPPQAPSVLRGQFMLYTRNPWHGHPDFPRALPDRFFLAELDAVWDHQPDEAGRIIGEYKALGCNHVTVGPVLDKGYHGHYPDVNWLDKPERYADFLEWLRSHGIAYTMFVMPDMPPYYYHRNASECWIDREVVVKTFEPFFLHPRIQPLITRATPFWEQWSSKADMVWMFAWMRSMFPTADLRYHNGVGHLSPCWSNEEEGPAWRAVVEAGCDGMDFQAHPVYGWDSSEPRGAREQGIYDLWDMSRRFRGDNSPWGDAIINPRTGRAITLTFFEGSAYSMFWGERSLYEDEPAKWGQAIRDAALDVQWLLDAKEPV